jgi:N utilization substance protein A
LTVFRGIQAYVVKTIVETVTNPVVEITAAEAARVSHGVVEGCELRIPVDARDFARIAAQTAKQVLVQKVRETQRETLYTEYKPKEGTMINGTVLRFLSRNIVVDLGRGRKPSCPCANRCGGNIGRWRIAFAPFILKVERSQRGPEIILTRAHPDFVKRSVRTGSSRNLRKDRGSGERCSGSGVSIESCGAEQ